MTFCIVSHVVHTQKGKDFFAYSPYVNEMNMWIKNVDEVLIVAPKELYELNSIHTKYLHNKINIIGLNKFDLLSLKGILNSLQTFIPNCWTIYKAMKKADHIHLRCPGNIGLLGCIVQIAFPKKKKTAKYAGNWDPNAKQPLSYRIQKWILSNRFLSKNIQVLVYGEWKNQSKNTVPFFTVTYSKNQIQPIKEKDFNSVIKFIFVGTLSAGKQPKYAIELVKALFDKGLKVELELYGDGILKNELENYILNSNCENFVFLKGNVSKESMISIYQNSHFLILPSKSEGWPKVVAEAMFWGCFPIASSVSCIPNMLDKGKRGLLLKLEKNQDVKAIIEITNNPDEYHSKIKLASSWSHMFTIDKFEEEIKKMIE